MEDHGESKEGVQNPPEVVCNQAGQFVRENETAEGPSVASRCVSAKKCARVNGLDRSGREPTVNIYTMPAAAFAEGKGKLVADERARLLSLLPQESTLESGLSTHSKQMRDLLEVKTPLDDKQLLARRAVHAAIEARQCMAAELHAARAAADTTLEQEGRERRRAEAAARLARREQEVAADRAAKKQSKAKQSKAKPRKQVNEGLAWALHESAVYAESAALATTVDECLVERALADSRADAEEGAAMKLQGAVRRWQARNVAVMEVRWQQARRQWLRELECVRTQAAAARKLQTIARRRLARKSNVDHGGRSYPQVSPSHIVETSTPCTRARCGGRQRRAAAAKARRALAWGLDDDAYLRRPHE